MSLLALLSMPAAHAGGEYAAESIEATVVDAVTRRPVPGALVIARWIANAGGGLHAAHDAGSVEVMETVTDPEGRFRFPAWGPKAYAGEGALLDDDPRILVFKRGYYVGRLGNSQYLAPPSKDFRSRKTGTRRASLWDREIAPLKPFAGDTKVFATAVYDRFVASDVWAMFAEGTPCDWQRLPMTVAYLEAEKKAYIAEGFDARRLASIRDRLLMNDAFFAGKGCGSPRALLKEAP